MAILDQERGGTVLFWWGRNQKYIGFSFWYINVWDRIAKAVYSLLTSLFFLGKETKSRFNR